MNTKFSKAVLLNNSNKELTHVEILNKHIDFLWKKKNVDDSKSLVFISCKIFT